MNILQINKFFYRRGGAEHHMFDIASMLREAGHTISFFSMDDPHNESSEYAPYFVSHAEFGNEKNISFGKKLSYIARMFYSREAKKKIESLVDAHHIDIAHIHNIYHHISPSILPVLRKKHIPMV